MRRARAAVRGPGAGPGRRDGAHQGGRPRGRVARAVTQRELAGIIGVSAATASRLCAGKYRLDARSRRRNGSSRGCSCACSARSTRCGATTTPRAPGSSSHNLALGGASARPADVGRRAGPCRRVPGRRARSPLARRRALRRSGAPSRRSTSLRRWRWSTALDEQQRAGAGCSTTASRRCRSPPRDSDSCCSRRSGTRRRPAARVFAVRPTPACSTRADAVRTACAELGYWRWRHLLDTPALAGDAGPPARPCSGVRLDGRAVDLRAPPFVRDRARVDAIPPTTPPASAFARTRARPASARFATSRCAIRSTAGCCAVLDPDAFAHAAPLEQQTWMLSVVRERVVWQRTHVVGARARVSVPAACDLERGPPRPASPAAAGDRRRPAAVTRSHRSRPHRLRAHLARDAGVHRRARRRDARRDLADRASADLHAGPRRPAARTCCATTASRRSRSTAAGRSPTTVPGQLVAYLLFDLRRGGRGVRDLVRGIEAAVIEWLDSHRRFRLRQGASAGRLRRARRGRGQDRRAGAQGAQRLHVPRPRRQRRHGPRAVRRHRPLRLSGPRRHAARRRRRRAAPCARSNAAGDELAPILAAHLS